MMRNTTRGRRAALVMLVVLASVLLPGQSSRPATIRPGVDAPALTLKDAEGEGHALADYAGKIVVLEWIDPDCPYVRRHYEDSTSMKDAYEAVKAIDDDVVWLAIDSTRGAQAEARALWAKTNDVAYPLLLDTDGKIGRAYGARRAPSIVVIDAKGVVRYTGAVDDNKLGTKPSKDVTNYVVNAVRQLAEEKPVVPDRTKAYGCIIKY